LSGNTTSKSGYPELITNLPEAQIAFKGARAWIMQSDMRQLVFFEFDAGIDLPKHNHTYPQWGMVIEGEMILRINGQPRVCRGGDEYLIPAGAMHGARFNGKTRVMDFFSEKNRYISK